MSETWQFQNEQVQSFRTWLNLSQSDLRWSEDQENMFEKFWSNFFVPGAQLSDIHKRFFEIEELLETGTLRQWLKWLRHRFNCYLFIYENMNLRDLALDSHYRINDLAYIIRDFFINEYPDHREYFNQRMNIGNYLSKNLHVSIEDIRSELNIDLKEKCLNSRDLMANLEVPLFEEFPRLINLLEKKSSKTKLSKNLRFILSTYISTFKYLTIFFIVSFSLIWGIKFLRHWSQGQLIEEVKISAPRFYNEFDYEKKITQSLRKSSSSQDSEDVSEELNLQSSNSENEFLRDSTESDILISSLDNVPLPLKSVDLQKSAYEESKKGGFRDYKYGRFKAYRLMINSADAQNIVSEINQELQKLNYKKVGNVEPGKRIPGGHYYNLYVANKDLKKFIGEFEQRGASLFVSQSPEVNPKGMSRLFIWIKTL